MSECFDKYTNNRNDVDFYTKTIRNHIDILLMNKWKRNEIINTLTKYLKETM